MPGCEWTWRWLEHFQAGQGRHTYPFVKKLLVLGVRVQVRVVVQRRVPGLAGVAVHDERAINQGVRCHGLYR